VEVVNKHKKHLRHPNISKCDELNHLPEKLDLHFLCHLTLQSYSYCAETFQQSVFRPSVGIVLVFQYPSKFSVILPTLFDHKPDVLHNILVSKRLFTVQKSSKIISNNLQNEAYYILCPKCADNIIYVSDLN